MPENSFLDGIRILVVDDERDILEVIEELLTMCDITLASTFEEAEDLLKSHDFDLAVLDIMGVDGYKLLKIAKGRNIPALMLTAHAFTPDDLVKSIRKGAASYIPKNELGNIREFLNDFFQARAEGKNPWEAWKDRLPSSYFERRFGAAWQDEDKEFWEKFRADLKGRNKS